MRNRILDILSAFTPSIGKMRRLEDGSIAWDVEVCINKHKKVIVYSYPFGSGEYGRNEMIKSIILDVETSFKYY